MSVLESDIRIYGAANHQETDSGTQGGAEDKSILLEFEDIAPAGTVEAVSSDVGDTTQTVTVVGLDSAGVKQTVALALTGQTPVTDAQVFERLQKATKDLTCAGDVAVMETTNETTGTAQGGAAKTASEMAYLTAAAGEVGTDDQFKGQVLRTTGGTGANQIRKIIKSRSSDDRIWVSSDWDVVPDATTTYEIAQGMVLEKAADGEANEVMEVRSPFIDTSAEAAGGSARDYYEKVFLHNTHATLALTAATVAELADPSGKITFALANTLDDVGTSTDRRTAPASGVSAFDSNTKNVANSQNLSPGSGQGMWLKLSLAAGDPALKTSYTPQLSGTTT